MSSTIRTYSFSLYDDRFFDLAKEAGEVYSQSLTEFWDTYNTTGVWLSKFDLQKHMKSKLERKLLHSDSYLAAMQQVHANLASWKQAKKLNKNAKPPTKKKFLQAIIFKESQIKYRDGFLKLTLGTGKQYLFLKWSNKVPIPTYGSITYYKTTGWKINLAIEIEDKSIKLDKEKHMSIDLGVKRTATLFDGTNVLTLSGKKLLELIHHRNKLNGKTQTRLSFKKKKESNNYKKLKRAQRKSTNKFLNKQKDILHKYSSFVVNHAIRNNIGNIIIGDNVSTHASPDLGRKNNQKITQNPEQKLKNYIKYKFESISGQISIVPEPYTSQTCPCCKNRYKPNNRVYNCSSCGFVYDRDGVGAINIYNENVSFGGLISAERIRSLTEPSGVRFSPQLCCGQ